MLFAIFSIPKIMEEVYFSNGLFLSNYTKYAHGIAHDKIDQSDDNFKTLNRLFEYENIYFTFFKILLLESTRKSIMQNQNPFQNWLKFHILDWPILIFSSVHFWSDHYKQEYA